MKTAFIDRDGTITENSPFVNTWQQMRDRPFVRGAIKGMRNLMDAGFQLVLVSNQGGVGAGYITEKELELCHAVLVGRLAEHEVYFRAMRFCPHHPEAKCGCRKPEPGMLIHSAAEDDATLHESIMIGDQDTDMLSGRLAGVRGCYLVTPERGWDGFDLTRWPE